VKRRCWTGAFIAQLARGAQMTDKEISDPTLISLAPEPMQIHMRRTGQQIELFGRWHNCENSLGFLERSVTIFGAVDKKHRTSKQ
jgi:hypothetical protein